MKPTGKINPITGDEILKVEEHDISFWYKEWDELTIDEKAMFCSFIEVGYLATHGEFANEDKVKDMYEYYATKNTMEL